MRTILALARKDLRVLMRVRTGVFLTFVWPIVVAILFGAVYAGQYSDAPRAIRVAVVDEDGTEASRAFVATLEGSGDFELDPVARPDAEALVRRGQRAAFVAIRPGFGAASERMFHGPPRELEIGSDPTRGAEAAMIEGLLIKHAMSCLQALLTTPAGGWQPLVVSRTTVVGERSGPENGFDVTFPQGIMWGIIGCVMTFAVGLVGERVHGTFVRLQVAPLTRAQILAGKALACLVAISSVELVLLIIGIAGFGLRPSSYPLLAVACVSASVGFVGFMMMIAGLGRTEHAAAGAGWATLMPMALFGGGMMPEIIMPSWMKAVGSLSPVKWTILGLEGAVWRDFSPGEMLLPTGLLLGFGAVCFVVGVRGLAKD
jgi:ABC-2 type transport system permease protein